MIKFVVAAVWIAALSIGSVIYSFQTAQGHTVETKAPPPAFGGLDYVKTEIISVPLMKQGEIFGYFLTRLVYTAEAARLAKLSIPAEAVLIDSVYSYLYGNPVIDFSNSENLDLDAFRNGLRDGVNARVGEKLIHEVLIEQVDFLSKSEIRDNTIKRRSARPPSPPAASAPAKH